MSRGKKTPAEWSQAVTSGYVADPGPRNLNDPNWVHKYTEFIASLPQPNYSSGSGEGHNNGS